jgi:sec-independent protein translocase protein TatC
MSTWNPGAFRNASGSTPTRETSLLDHLEELRFRVIYASIAWLIGSSVAYFFRDRLFTLLSGPLQAFTANGGHVEVVALRLTDQLVAAIQMAMLGGLVLAFPMVAYQFWAFIAPGLTRGERRWGGPLVLGLNLAFALGLAFAYVVILPVALQFLLGGFLAGVKTQLSIGEYIGDVVSYLAMFGLVFELPLVLWLLARIGIITSSLLVQYRRHAVVGIVALSAIVTPTVDPVNLALMAGPLWLLYEIGIVFARLAQPKRTLEPVLELDRKPVKGQAC